jgi:hypothetical protein
LNIEGKRKRKRIYREGAKVAKERGGRGNFGFWILDESEESICKLRKEAEMKR